MVLERHIRKEQGGKDLNLVLGVAETLKSFLSFKHILGIHVYSCSIYSCFPSDRLQ